MIEADLEKDACRHVATLGGVALKLKIDGERGFPDRTFLLPGGAVIFIEFKRPKANKKYKQQRRWVQQLQDLGFTAAFCYSVEDVKKLCEKATLKSKHSNQHPPAVNGGTKSKRASR